MDLKNVSVLNPFALAIGDKQAVFYNCVERAAYTALPEKNPLEIFSSNNNLCVKYYQVAA